MKHHGHWIAIEFHNPAKFILNQLLTGTNGFSYLGDIICFLDRGKEGASGIFSSIRREPVIPTTLVVILTAVVVIPAKAGIHKGQSLMAGLIL
jgi:hypothetical protein